MTLLLPVEEEGLVCWAGPVPLHWPAIILRQTWGSRLFRLKNHARCEHFRVVSIGRYIMNRWN